MTGRRYKLVDLNPRWVTGRYAGRDDDVPVGIHFDCPEGHDGCSIAVPFTPGLDGAPAASWYSSGTQWQRAGDTFETLTLTPSIATPPGRENGCAFHGFIRDGQIDFCGDSR